VLQYQSAGLEDLLLPPGLVVPPEEFEDDILRGAPRREFSLEVDPHDVRDP